MKKIVIKTDSAGQRLDRYLLKYFDKSSRSNIYKLLRKGIIKVNNKKQKPNYNLNLNDIVEMFLSDTQINNLKENQILQKQKYIDTVTLNIVYEDKDIVVINKPAGMLTQPDKSNYDSTLAILVQKKYEHLITDTFKPAPVNRLDRNTSGLVLFGKTYNGLKKMNQLMKKGKIKKFYKCIVHGIINQPGMIDGYIVKDTKNNIVIFSTNKNGKRVITKYKPLDKFEDTTLLEVELVTGRSHQIRVSLQSIGHPIVGDVKYGGKRTKNVNHQLLDAYKIIIDGLEVVG